MSASFGPREVDALQELASIGCGQAISALGKLAGRRFEMDVPEAWIGAEPGAIASFLGSLGQALLAVGVKLEGPLTGDLLLALPERDAAALAAMLGFPVMVPGGPTAPPGPPLAPGQAPPPAPSLAAAGSLAAPPLGGAGWSEMAESALMESGNIVGSAFVTAVGTLVGEKLLLSVPTLARGSGRACVEQLVAHAGSVALATRFSAGADGPGAALEGLILVMPEPEGIAKLLSHLDLR